MKIKQFSEEQAIKLAFSEVWKDMSSQQIVELQLFQERLCVPFTVFHMLMEEVLNRPVYTHEFAEPEKLRKEYLGEKQPPTFEDMINILPKEKQIILQI